MSDVPTGRAVMRVMTVDRRIRIVGFIASTMLYAAGYALARQQHLLIHRSGYVAGRIDNHSIAAGDCGSGLNIRSQLAHGAELVFAPARWMETGAWYLWKPPGSPWPAG